MTKCSILSLLSVSLILAACSSGEATSEYSSIYESNTASIESSSGVMTSSDSGSIVSEPLPNSGPTQNEDMRITAGGSYTLTGTINGTIYIDAPDDADVELVLNGVDIISNTQSPIFSTTANELKIKLQPGTVNRVIDNRPLFNEETADPSQGKGAIYSKCDLKITGKGSLIVESTYNNGIHCTDDVTLKSQAENGSYIRVKAVNHAIKGNDSVTVESGKITLISIEGSGIKTESTDVSSKGKQRGNIEILGGDIDISSCEDGLEAAYNVVIDSYPTINIVTSKYSQYTVRESSNNTANNWANYTQKAGPGGWGGPGGGPGGGGPGGMQEGNTDKADYSAKGIKADNEVYIMSGNVSVKAYDDAIHAGRGAVLENGSTGLGNVHISGGNLNLYASDDGIHADYINDISGGTINITNSYEGIEGNLVNISGGDIKAYSTDDGLNAANKADVNPEINISGGTIDITVYGGDVDGIDSNNTYTQTGGLVITKGGSGGMSTGLDTDGTARVNSGTLIVFGRPEKTPTLGNGVTSYTLSGSYSLGTYTVSNTTNSVDVTTKYSYTAIYVYSSETARYTVTKK